MSSETVRCRAWIDGAARGNPGQAGFGVYYQNGENTDSVNGYLGHATNNVAEYLALIAALGYARENKIQSLEVFSDSQLMVRQVNGEYKVKARHLQPLFFKTLELRRSIPDFTLSHVRREDNRDADRLANEAIDDQAPIPLWLEADLSELGLQGLG